ncbi:hypothetical protein ASC63_03095 [Leifsonia sp. Root112D2]|nr:hypothetical protein ASC63_03095 [Leifsonia sp. Root112D2]
MAGVIPGARSSRGRSRATDADWLNRVLVVIVGAIVLIPTGTLVVGAFSSQPPRAPGQSFTLMNVGRAFTTPEYLAALGNSVLIGALTGVFSVVIGTAIAFAVGRMRLRFSRFWENIVILPVYVAPLTMALSAEALFAPRVGFINVLLPNTSFFDIFGLPGIVWVLTVTFSGIVFLYMIGPVRNLNAELEEAGAVLGGSRWNILRRVSIPLLAPSILSTFIVVFLLGAEDFSVPGLLGQGAGFHTLPTEIYYLVTYQPSSPNLAAALGLTLLLIAVIGIAIYRRLSRNALRYVTIAGKYRASRTFEPRRFRWLPEVLIALWLVVAILLPVGGLVFGSFLKFVTPHITASSFTLANYQRIFSGTGPQPLLNTLILALLAATIVAFLGALISYGLRYGRTRSRGVLDYLSILTLGIPGAALAVGILWAYVGLPAGIWGSIWVLLIAYVTRAIVHGVRATTNSLRQTSPQLDEAARLLGAGLARRMRTIQFPLMSAGMRSAWVLVFIYAVNEVTASVLLATQNSETVAVKIFNAVQMSGPIQAFAYAVIQGLIVGLALLLFNRILGAGDRRRGRLG